MDASPLVRAHDHAQAAAVATRQAADSTVAISEHTQAAGEFANAARSTSSVEALRTLKLLEDHHRRLATLLKLPPSPAHHSSTASQAATGSATGTGGEDESVGDDGLLGEKSTQRSEKSRSVVVVVDNGGTNGKDAPARNSSASSPSQPPRLASREMSSSIASNLASARGIRSKYRNQGPPLNPSVSNDQAPGNLDPHPRRDGSRAKMQTIMDHQTGKPTWVPPTSSSSPSRASKNTASPRSDSESAIGDEGGYTRFYNTFGSLINKISAPLAFAGLPLIQEESSLSEPATTPDTPPTASMTASATSKRRPTRQASTTYSPEPDLSKIYSKATMRSLAKNGHSASDSFYVVPTSGHTMSYANILSYAEKEKRRLGASSHGDFLGPGDDEDDDFVDARESPAPHSPGGRRKVPRSRSDKDLRNTIEELSLENRSLKDMLDNVSKRLHVFEASSQHSAMALAESYRFMRPGSPGASSGVAPPPPVGKQASEAMRRKAQDAEEQLAAAIRQMERLEKDNRKMQRTLDKYREKWETLKAGAKARREAQGGESVEDARQS